MYHFYIPSALAILAFIVYQWILFAKNKPTWLLAFRGVLNLLVSLSIIHLIYDMAKFFDTQGEALYKMIMSVAQTT